MLYLPKLENTKNKKIEQWLVDHNIDFYKNKDTGLMSVPINDLYDKGIGTEFHQLVYKLQKEEENERFNKPMC